MLYEKCITLKKKKKKNNKIKSQNKCHFLENKTDIMQGVLKMQ
jgi:hypothetical protein